MAAITATITSGTSTMNHAYELLLIDVCHEFNKIPTAELKFIDGNIAVKQFEILDDPFFEIGKELNISLKYEGETQNEKNIFSGLIVNKLLELDNQGTILTIELSDAAIRMHNGRDNTVYIGKKDSDIFKDLITKNKLTAKKIETTQIKHSQMIQHYVTDWDFLVARAEANAKVVQVHNGTITVFQPKIEEKTNTLELGLDQMFDFDLQINGNQQFKKINAVSWDVSTQRLSKPQTGVKKELFQHKKTIATETATKAFGTQQTTLMHTAHVEIDELKTWSEAQALKNRFSYIQGRIKMTGTTKYDLGMMLEIKEISKTFSGKSIISGVRHQVTAEGWSTHLQIGMSSCWLTSKPDVSDTPAAGLLPAVNGLQIGVIQTDTKNADNLYRIPVFIPAFGDGQEPIWARLGTLDAGKKRGTFFIPEPGDEVIVGFLNDDPRQAIIVGALFSPVNKPPADYKTNKNSKGIFTASNYHLFFNEEAQQISIATSAKNKIVIDEKEHAVTITDTNENKIKLSKDGILLESAKNCEISAKGNLNIKATGNVIIDGKSVELK